MATYGRGKPYLEKEQRLSISDMRKDRSLNPLSNDRIREMIIVQLAGLQNSAYTMRTKKDRSIDLSFFGAQERT